MGWNVDNGVSGGNEEKEPDVLGTIDQYDLLKELGTGGFGSVYLARDTAERRLVAVKGLPREMKDSAEELERIRRNFDLIVRLKHDNIVALRHLNKVDKIAFRDVETAKKLNLERGQTLLVMDYAEGIPLSRWVLQFQDGKVPLAKAIEVTRQIASALDYAHAHRIIHRDIKPQNVVMETREDGTFIAQVLDFGLAAEIRSSMNRTSEGNRGKSGTRLYMPPEQWRGKEQKATADQYSLAVLFYELLFGRVPFQSAFDSGDPVVAMTAVTTQEPEIPEGLPRHVRRALLIALAKNGAERFNTCTDFVSALEGKPVPMPKPQRSRLSAVLGLVAALALAAIGGWWWHTNSQNEQVAMPTPQNQPAQVVPKPTPTPVPAPVDSAAERRRLELAAELPAYTLASQADTAAQLIAREPEEVRTFFESEIRAFESLRKAGENAKADKSYVAATNLLAQAKAKADALKRLVAARAGCLAAKERAESEKRSADAVDAKTALALRYGEAVKALGAVDSLVSKRDFAKAAEQAEAARSQFTALRADVIKVTLGEARRHKSAERWELCLEAVNKVLGWEPKNSEAVTLEWEAESHLVPTLRFVAKIGNREVPATAMLYGQTRTLPWTKKDLWDRLESSCIPSTEVAVEYSEGGKRYVGTIKPITVDWKGPKTMTIALTEYKGLLTGSKPGEIQTITLPGGAKMKMVWCPAGSFMMGSPTSEANRDSDETRHEVKLTKGFWMGKYEVTQAQWESVMGSNPSHFKGADRPVENVSWDDCQEFIRKVNSAGRVTVSLPTEAQWEYACRAGTTTPFNFGSTLNGDKANCDGNYPYGTTTKGRYREQTSPVGSYSANAWGLYDMHGNVREWCADWYDQDYYNQSPTEDPTGPASGTNRVDRGGSWIYIARLCRSAFRYRYEPGNRYYDLGFRLVCSLP